MVRFPEVLGPQLLVKKAGEAASPLSTSAALNPAAAFVAVLVAAPGWSGNCRNLVRALSQVTAAAAKMKQAIHKTLTPRKIITHQA